MLENGFVVRDARTNEIWVHDDSIVAQDEHDKRIHQLINQSIASPDARFACPVCGKEFLAKTLHTHYVNNHACPRRWEEIVDRYFGWV